MGTNLLEVRGKHELLERLQELRKRHRAVLLGHYYVPPEVQDACDYVGDSLGLSRQAAESDADVIVFCGVHFMAETASVLAPDRRVLIPSLDAGCSLAESITGHDVAQWKAANPDGIVISYVNTTAEVKAYTDCCCTSANALLVVQQYADAKKILFLPDKNLGHYIMRKTGISMEIWDGACHVHDRFSEALIQARMAEYPEAEVLVHPESAGAWRDEIFGNPRVFIGSTTGMIKRAASSSAKQFLVVTEQGTLHQMQREAPGKELILVGPEAYCEYMKMMTLERVVRCLETGIHEVKVPVDIAKRAANSIERMLSIG